jgi:hypothetical protein
MIQSIHDFEISALDIAVMLNSKKPLFRGNEFLLLRDSSAKEEPKKNKRELVLVSYNPQLHLSFAIICCCLGGAGGFLLPKSRRAQITP